MKMIYIANSRFPSEKAQSDQVMQMCESFALLGHEVVLAVPDRQGAAAEDPFVYYGRERTFTLKRLPCLDWTRFSWMGPIGFWVQTFSFVLALRAYVTALQPAVVYSRELYALVWPWPRVRRVWESHSLHRSWAARFIVRKLDLVVTLTKESAKRLHDLGVKEGHLLVEPDAVDPRLFERMPTREEARQALNILPDEWLCLYVGKFTTMGAPKGLEESIAAVRALRKEGRRIRLLAVGGTTQELSKYAPLQEEGIQLLGHQPQASLKRFYAAGDAVLMPFPYTSHYAFFMSPLKLFEYLMSGLPIVTSDLPSVREIVTEKEAFFVEPGSIASLQATLAQMMDHPKETEARSKHSRTLAEKYTWFERAKRIMGCIGSLR